MKTIVAALFTALGLWFAAPAEGTPQQDAQYLYLLNEAGISYTSADSAISVAQWVCLQLARGSSLGEVGVTVYLNAPYLSVDESASVVAAAVVTYCPWFAGTGSTAV